MAARLALGILTLLIGTSIGTAQPVADFYRGKTVQLLIGYTAGGNYDLSARLLARHIGRHIPGNPTVVPQNMAGAGSLRLANLLYEVAPKDGTTFGMVGRNVSMEPLIGTYARTFDSRRFTWIGSVSNETSVCVSWRTSNVKSWNDMLSMPFTVGGQGPGSDDDNFTNMLRNIFGAKARLVAGYPGGNEINLAMERGEIDARCGWSWGSVKTTRSDWLARKEINLLLQIALQGASDLPNVPLVTGFREDRSRQADLAAHPQPATDGMALHRPARSAGGSRGRVACGVRRNHARSRLPRRGQEARTGSQSDERGGDRQADCGALRNAARSCRGGQSGDDGAGEIGAGRGRPHALLLRCR